MRVGGSWKKRLLRPYSIICLITIWSFLVSIITNASPEYIPKAISPPSRFSSPARIVETERGLSVIQDDGTATDEYKNQDIAVLKERLNACRAWRLCVERIAKTEGLHVTYQKRT